jgi:uncharacterized membrane protein
MSVSLLPILTQAAQEGPSEGDIVGAVWLGMVILFLVSVFVTGFTAKKIENLHHPTYVKAFVAQFLIGPLSLAALAVFGLYFQLPFIVALAIAYTFIPIVLYKIVFDSSWGEAAIIWIVVTVVMAGVTYLLTLVGVLSFAALSGNAQA